jgi:hypothetical protein
MGPVGESDSRGRTVMGVPLMPKVKTLSYTIAMPVELRDRLAKPVTGEGGWQTLLRDIQSQVDGDALELSQALLDRMIPMATKYGAGGYQGVIRWILCLLLAQHQTAILGASQTLKGVA